MDWDFATKVNTVVVGILGVGLGWMNWRTAQRLSVHKLGKTELDALSAGIDHQEHDPAYKDFLQDIQKEKLAGLAFGCAVPLREVGRLMEYYKRGFATTEQIRLAWPYRNSHKKPLSFALGRWENVQRVLALVYLVACPFIAGLLGVLAALPPWRISNLVSAGVAACYLALGFLDARVHRGLFVAKELSKREQEKEEAPNTR